MKTKISLLALILTMGVLFQIKYSSPVEAAPNPQYTFYPTPTPGPDGRIIYIVQEDDSIWRIAAIFNISLERLYEINNWAQEHTIQPGDQVFLGLGGPQIASPTAGPSPTPAPVTPTATPKPGWGILCVVLFNDENGNSSREENESAVSGGAISLVERSGKDSRTEQSENYEDDSNCNFDENNGWNIATGYVLFSALPEGEYNISVAIPDGYNATTVTDESITLNAGDKSYVAFGIQANAETVAEEPEIISSADSPRRSPVIVVVGILFLLCGIGLGVYATLLRKPSKA